MRHGSILSPRPRDLPQFFSLATRAVAPPHLPIDWSTHCRADGDPLANDTYGCCDPAADFRIIQLHGGLCNSQLVLNRYAQLTAFKVGDAPDGPSDQGTDTNEDMQSWCAFPIFDGKRDWPIYWGQIQPSRTSEIIDALSRFPLLITIVLPPAVEDDPDLWAGQPGNPVSADWMPRDAHRVPLIGWDGQFWTVRSWGYDWKVSNMMMHLMLAQGIVDVPIPHPDIAPEYFNLDGIDYTSLISSMPRQGVLL